MSDVTHAGANMHRLTNQQMYYIIISLQIYWSKVAKDQQYVRETSKPYSDDDFCNRAGQVMDFIRVFAKLNLRQIYLDNAGDHVWSKQHIVESFGSFHITAHDLSVDRPFGAIATPTLWREYVNDYITTGLHATPLELKGHELSLSPWLNCFYILGGSHYVPKSARRNR